MMDRLSESEIDKLAKLDRDATPGPWRESMSGYSIKSNDADCPIVAAVHGVARATQKQVRLFLDNAALIAAARNALPRLIATARAAERLAEAGNKFKAANDEVRRLVVSGGIGRASYQAAVDTQQTAMLTFWRALAAYQTATKGE
jgi:hypothetical protein